MNEPLIQIKNLTLSYDEKNKVIENLSFEVHKGEFVAFLGPSGCGKTTLLRFLAGLLDKNEFYSDGITLVGGSDVKSDKLFKSGELGFVFENPSLLPWLTVLGNVKVGLKLEASSVENHSYIAELLKKVGLELFSHNYPNALSLGMQQRVALVRSLVYTPKLIFLDTPFSNIDSKLKLRLLDLVSHILDKSKTVLFVTHDVTEAAMLADKVVVLTDGPMRIKTIFPTNLERPRDIFSMRKSKEFALLEQKIWESILGEDNQKYENK